MRKRWILGLSVLVAISLLLVGCTGGPSADEIVAKLKEVEANTQDAHAILEMTVESQGVAENAVIEVWEKKPNKFKAVVLEASDADYVGSVTVADGGQVWMYHPSRNEVVVGEVGSDEPASPRDLIQSVDEVIQRVLDTSEVKLAGEEEVAGKQTYILELTPTDDEEALLPVGGQATVWVQECEIPGIEAYVECARFEPPLGPPERVQVRAGG